MGKKDAGFTIIEVLIAIAIMGILCLPIFSYFSGSMQYNEYAKRKQKASLAAQTVMEEVVSVASYKAYQELCAKPEYAPLQYQELPKPVSVPPSDKKYFFKRLVEIDGNQFVAYIQMDYEEYSAPSTEIGNQYNNYDKPVLQTLSTSSNVMAVERSQKADAVAHFRGESGDTEAEVTAGISRTAYLTVSELSPQSVENLYVKLTYVYEYESDEYETPYPLFDGLMKKEEFEGVCWFYNSMDANQDRLIVTDNLNTADLQYVLRIVRQEEGVGASNPIGMAYSVRLASSVGALNGFSRITRVNANVTVGGAVTLPSVEGLVHMEAGHRISNVTVSIFPVDTTNFDDMSRALVTLDGVKGE